LLELLPKCDGEKLEVISGDIRDAIFCKKAVHDVEIVFHLAALIAIPYSYISPGNFIYTNACGTLNVVQACIEEQVKTVIHTSTSEVYGTARYVPIDEEHSIQGQSPYSASKISADKIVESYHLSFGLPAVTIRPFNNYGPRQSLRAIIPTIISQIAAGSKSIKVGVVSPVRDFLYVKDTVNGYLMAAGNKDAIGQVINLGTGFGITIGDLIDKIKILMNSDVEIVHDEKRLRPEKSEVFNLICSWTKADKLLGWKPSTNLDQGLIETIDFIKKNIHLYKTDIHNI
jgi:NAD dependent epimerase/dehydratase